MTLSPSQPIMPVNPKFALAVRAQKLSIMLDGKSSVINGLGLYQRYTGVFRAASEFEFWAALHAQYGERLWAALARSGLQGAALAVKARALLAEGEGWVKHQNSLVQKEAVTMFYELSDYLGYFVRSKSVKPKILAKDPYATLRLSGVLQHQDFGHTLALTINMLPDPIDENAWSIQAYGKPNTVEEFSHLRGQLQAGVSTLLERRGLTLSNLNFGVDFS